MLKLGLESGDQGVLDALDKGIDISVASDALAALKSAGISTYVYLLFGTPPEDHSSALKTIEFVRENCNVIDYINAAIFNLPAACINDGNLAVYDFYDGDLGLYKGFLHSQGWERKKVRTFIDREFRRDAAVSKILRRTPPVFTSNHAPLFYQRYFRP
jgi:radical SAM superfamily enzyme YgiQ (UPF0313 family)